MTGVISLSYFFAHFHRYDYIQEIIGADYEKNN